MLLNGKRTQTLMVLSVIGIMALVINYKTASLHDDPEGTNPVAGEGSLIQIRDEMSESEKARSEEILEQTKLEKRADEKLTIDRGMDRVRIETIADNSKAMSNVTFSELITKVDLDNISPKTIGWVKTSTIPVEKPDTIIKLRGSVYGLKQGEKLNVVISNSVDNIILPASTEISAMHVEALLYLCTDSSEMKTISMKGCQGDIFLQFEPKTGLYHYIGSTVNTKTIRDELNAYSSESLRFLPEVYVQKE